MATKEEFVAAFEAIGGKRERWSPPGLGLLRRLGRKACGGRIIDAFDATEIVTEPMIGSTAEVVQRMLVPASKRELAWTVLAGLGIEGVDSYTQTGRLGMQWVQFTLDGNPSFRSYAATRLLLDGAPEESGLVQIGPEELSLAATGRPIADE